MRKPRVLAAIAALALAATACSDANAVNRVKQNNQGGSGGYGYNIAVVTHGQAGDSFWSIVKKGAEQGGADMGVKVNYQSDGDPVKQAGLIDAVVNQKPDGLVVSMANPQALEAAVRRAVSAGIPVININAGQAEAPSYGALTHIGSDERVAGEAVGAQLKKDGKTKAICIVQEAGNVALETRCAGVKAAFGTAVENIQVDNKNLSAAQSTITAKLQQDKNVDAVVTLGAQVATAAQGAIAAAKSTAVLATFDLNADVCQAILDDKLSFAVDQQPYLQGYLAVVMLTQYKANLMVLGGGQPVLTGPNLITKDNAQQVLNLAREGKR